MKYCPQCNRQFTESWITFCSEDGTLLIEELSAPADPNWDPRIREPKVQTRSEQETQWLPREPPMQGGWIAPDERAPMAPAWRPPPPPPQPVAQQSQGLAVASMITGILGLVLGCFGPLPGVAALVLGFMALAQIKKSPATNSGKPLAIIGIVTGILTVVFYSLLIIWWVLIGVLGNL
ncbi:MAG TPA: DUF4190 domain-containing protein [Pyrinomonadaceae bacterium]|jgi:hypothetical protein